MDIIQSSEFLSITKNRHILLDTTVFIDAISAPVKFANIFNELKENGCILVTLECVLTEFIKGGSDEKKLKEKRQYVEDIVDAFLPITQEITQNATKLAELYKEDGKKVSIADFFLGAMTMRYQKMLLMTCNITDFPTNIFNLETFLTFVHRKAIETCGFYSFPVNN